MTPLATISFICQPSASHKPFFCCLLWGCSLTNHIPPPSLQFRLSASQIPKLRRVPIAASSSCARALTSLLPAVERKQTWEALARLLIFTRIALAAPDRGGKATRSSSTQQCRKNCLSFVIYPLKELVARIMRTAPADDPRTQARTRVLASESTDTSPQASDRKAAAVRALLAEEAPGAGPSSC